MIGCSARWNKDILCQLVNLWTLQKSKTEVWRQCFAWLALAWKVLKNIWFFQTLKSLEVVRVRPEFFKIGLWSQVCVRADVQLTSVNADQMRSVLHK